MTRNILEKLEYHALNDWASKNMQYFSKITSNKWFSKITSNKWLDYTLNYILGLQHCTMYMFVTCMKTKQFHKTNACISLHLHIVGDKQVHLHAFHMPWTEYIWNWTEIYIFVVRLVQNLRKMTNRYTKCSCHHHTHRNLRFIWVHVCLKCTCRKFY